MQLRIARLCLDCEEVHDSQTCPVCASESFAFLTRWVPVPDGRLRPEPTTTPEAETYKQLTAGSSGRWVKRGALGLTVLGLAGWAWRWSRKHPGDAQPAAADRHASTRTAEADENVEPGKKMLKRT